MTTEERRSSFEYEDLLACGRGELFGPGNAQLPLPPMLMFDRISSVGEDGGAYGKGHITAEFEIRPDLWFFACHFQGDPVMPGCLGLDALWQMLGLHLGWTAGLTYVGWAPVIRLVFYALLVGALIGVGVGLLVAVLRRGGRDLVPDPEADEEAPPIRLLQNSFPFGPALAAATMLLVLYPELAAG
mgnify:CR=1 FL=1